jgi:hypothetical protein
VRADWKSKTKRRYKYKKLYKGDWRRASKPANIEEREKKKERKAIMGPLAVEGQRSVEELGFNVSIISIISLVWCPGQNKRIAPLSFLHGCRKRRLKD